MKKILIIDDDQSVIMLLEHYLKDSPYEVRSACDGEDGLEKFSKQPADIVLLDIFMPNMDGIQTILELKKHNADCKIIAISGGGKRTGLNFLAQAKALGATKSLLKPISQQDLLEALESV